MTIENNICFHIFVLIFYILFLNYLCNEHNFYYYI